MASVRTWRLTKGCPVTEVTSSVVTTRRANTVSQPGCSYHLSIRELQRIPTATWKSPSSRKKHIPKARGIDDGDDQLDWEPESENKRGSNRRRQETERRLQIQPIKQSSYYYGESTRDQYSFRGNRYSTGSTGIPNPPPPGMFSREALRSPSGRRNAILTVLTGAAGVAVLSSEWSTFSKFESDALEGETDLYVSPSGVLFARTSFGDYVEFYHDTNGNSIIIDNKGSAFNLDEKVDDNTYLELVNRSGRVILVPPVYIKLICKVSREFSKAILQDNTGAVDVKPAPPEISSYEKFGGGLADMMYKKDRRIRKMRFGGTLG